jgi:hypothetical protein
LKNPTPKVFPLLAAEKECLRGINPGACVGAQCRAPLQPERRYLSFYLPV